MITLKFKSNVIFRQLHSNILRVAYSVQKSSAASSKSSDAASKAAVRSKAMEEYARKVAKSRKNIRNRAADFQKTLFNVPADKISSVLAPEEQARRAIIFKAWTRYCGIKAREKKVAEFYFMNSKVRALTELAKVSTDLYEKAMRINYDLPPSRKLPVLYAPENIPFF